MPSIPQDIDKLIRNTEFFFRYLPIKNIYVIGPETIAEKVSSANDSRLIFMNENEFVDVPRIRELYSSRTDKRPGHFGWYVQQFIKMQFAKFTNDEYYLIWDSDTIPLKPVNVFADDGRPIFDMINNFTESYFNTMSKLIPDLKRLVSKSFVSEHMLIRSEYMRKLLDEISSNTNIQGRNFQEKTINAVDLKDLHYVGFSEFETYGTYVMLRHPNSYVMRDWHSLRAFVRFYKDSSELNDTQREWLSKYYDVVSIEKWQKYPALSCLVKSGLFRKIFSSSVLLKIDATVNFVRNFYSYIRKILHIKGA